MCYFHLRLTIFQFGAPSFHHSDCPLCAIVTKDMWKCCLDLLKCRSSWCTVRLLCTEAGSAPAGPAAGLFGAPLLCWSPSRHQGCSETHDWYCLPLWLASVHPFSCGWLRVSSALRQCAPPSVIICSGPALCPLYLLWADLWPWSCHPLCGLSGEHWLPIFSGVDRPRDPVHRSCQCQACSERPRQQVPGKLTQHLIHSQTFIWRYWPPPPLSRKGLSSKMRWWFL